MAFGPIWHRLGLVALVALAACPASAQQRARTVDGDTIVVDGRRVRVMGLDTPERQARCPREARQAHKATERMRELVAGGVTVRPQGQDRYGRRLAVVRDQQGRDVAKTMVREGLAREYHGGRREGWC